MRAAGGMRALAKKVNGFARREIAEERSQASAAAVGSTQGRSGTKKIHSCLRHHDFHDGFAIAGAGNAAGSESRSSRSR